MAGTRVYAGNLDERLTERDLEDEFGRFGTLKNVWVARRPPGFAFIEFEDPRDAEDAVRKLDGNQGWRVEVSRSVGRNAPPGGDRGGGEPRRGGPPGPDTRCYECGGTGHFARECRARGGGGGGGGRDDYRGGDRGGGRGYDDDRYGGRSRGRDRSYSPRRRSRSRSRSRDRRRRSGSRSPPRAGGGGGGGGRSRSRSPMDRRRRSTSRSPARGGGGASPPRGRSPPPPRAASPPRGSPPRS